MIPTRDQIDKDFHYKVYIFESPSVEDIAEGRREGDSLFSALKLFNINCDYYLINSIESFVDATNKIAIDVNKKEDGKIQLPYLHLSLHGNENGIGVSNGNMIDWNTLREILMQLNHKVNFARYDNKIVSRFSLSMSVCKGIFAYKMFDQDDLNPFWSLVGPVTEIEWADSLTAFVVFYHSLIYKRTFISQAIERMNQSIGSKSFKNFLDTRFTHYIKK